MLTYQLITGNKGLAEHLTEKPVRGTGWEVRAEWDEEGKVPDAESRLTAPDGEVITLPIKPNMRALITQAVERHEAEAAAPAQASPPVAHARPWPTVYRGTTGNEYVASKIRSYTAPADGWMLEVSHLAGLPDDHVQLLGEDGRKLADIAVEPKPDLLERIVKTIRQHRAPASPAKPPLICIRQSPTGSLFGTLWLSGQEFVSARNGIADDMASIGRGPDAMERLWEAVNDWKREHPGAQVDSEVPLVDMIRDFPAGAEVAAAAEPAKPAPTDSAEAARAAREVGRAMQEKPAPPAGELLREIPIGEIGHFPGGNVREQFTDLDELAATIRELGVIQPLTVNEIDGRYMLIAGERRLRASGLAGLPTVPCRVMHWTEEQALEAMLIENIQREDLNPMEEARAYQRLMQLHRSTNEVARRVGRSQPHVVEYLRLLELPPDLRHQVATRVLGVKAALAYLRETRNVPEPVKQKVADALTEQQPSIREAPKVIEKVLKQEGIARAIPQGQPAEPSTKQAPPSAETATSSTSAPVPDTPLAPRVDPNVERAKALAEIGRRLWEGSRHRPVRGESEVFFQRECYLPLHEVLKHWERRQEPGGTSIPKTMGANQVDIPEHRLWFRSHDESSMGGGCEITLKDTRLTVKAGEYGAVEATYVGTPVYYRVMLVSQGAGGSKGLHQQLVIQDGARHIVVTGHGNTLIRKDWVPRWQALVDELPGLPG